MPDLQTVGLAIVAFGVVFGIVALIVVAIRK